MSFRKEKKFKVSLSDSQNFKDLMIQKGMTQLHRPRSIHSIYYDNLELGMLHDSEESILPRKKIRVRWYNLDTKFTLEKKVSSIEGRFKTVKELTNISSQSNLFHEQYFDRQYGNLIPSLKVSYMRSYFTFASMRITFDNNITYQSCNYGLMRYFKDPECVFEIKIPTVCPDDYIEKHIPHTTSRFSKYSRGHLLSLGILGEF
jgi:hypothetical protein